MHFYVHDFSTGERFGPASLDQLQQWVAEERIQSSTIIEDAGGRRMPADQVVGLVFPLKETEPQGYIPRGYHVDHTAPLPEVEPVSVHEGGLVALSYICSIVGLGCPLCLPVLGYIVGTVAYNRGDERGKAPQYANIASLIIGTMIVLLVSRG